MNKLKRFMIAALFPAVLSLALGGAMPAAAATGTVLYIDDGAVPNGTAKCTSPTIQTDLSTLTVTSNETIYLCPGLYKGKLLMIGVSNVKVIGLGNPTIQAVGGPSNYAIVEAASSTNVTIQGLILDGNNAFTSDQIGILFSSTSGTITGNTIMRIRETTPGTGCSGGEGIRIDGSPGPLKIVKNTLVDYQCYGMMVLRASGALVQHNRLWSSAHIGDDTDTGIYAYDDTGLAISSNTISSDYNTSMITAGYAGIYLEDTPAAKVTTNTISGVLFGIRVRTYCTNGAASNPDHLTITSNKMTGFVRGVQLEVAALASPTCAGSSTGDTIKSNQFYNPTLGSATGVNVLSSDANGADSFTPSDNGLIISANKYYGLDALYGDNGGPGLTAPVQTGNKPLPPVTGS